MTIFHEYDWYDLLTEFIGKVVHLFLINNAKRNGYELINKIWKSAWKEKQVKNGYDIFTFLYPLFLVVSKTQSLLFSFGCLASFRFNLMKAGNIKCVLPILARITSFCNSFIF